MTTQAAAWKGRPGTRGYELLDRQSVLVDEDGNPGDLDPDLTAALRDAIDPVSDWGIREFLDEVLADVGIADMDDLGGEQLSSVLEGILG